MAKPPFDRRFSDPPLAAFVRKAIVAVVAVHVPLALWSGYRAIVQVQSLEVQSQARLVAEGSTVRVGVVSSGRTTVDVRLEMIQGAHVETLAVRDVPTGANPAYDPRFRRASIAVALTPELIERFEPGPALLRATAIGRPQWLRTPPPEVRELSVEVAPWAEPMDRTFRDPRPVTIRGYHGDAMEPFITRDGRFLLFNNRNSPPRAGDRYVIFRVTRVGNR